MTQSYLPVAIIEDDSELRTGFQFIINQSHSFKCLNGFSTIRQALSFFQANNEHPRIILLDIDLPEISGLDGLPMLMELNPQPEVIILTVHDEENRVFEALKRGAKGYLTKTVTPSRLLSALEDVLNGGAPMSSNIARMVIESFQKPMIPSPMSDREQEVLDWLCRGHSYKMIADQLTVSEQTVHFHIKNIYKKLAVNSKGEAVSLAIRQGWVS